MKNPTKRHHFVPESYLNFFKSTPLPGQAIDQKSSFLYTLDILKIQEGYKNEKIRFQQPGNICYLENYYTISDELKQDDLFHLSGYDKLFVESEVLTILENKYPVILNYLIDHRSLTMEMALDLADFVILMKIRNPVWFKSLKENKDVYIDESMDKIKNDFFENRSSSMFVRLTVEKKQEVFERVRSRYKSSKHFAKQLLLNGIITRALDDWDKKDLHRQRIVDQGWNIFKAPKEGPYFVTTDNPGISVSDDNKVHNTKFTGEFQYIFPLSPEYCLIFGQNPSIADFAFTKGLNEKKAYFGDCSADQVTGINNMIIQVKNELLIASYPDYLEKIAISNSPADKKIP